MLALQGCGHGLPGTRPPGRGSGDKHLTHNHFSTVSLSSPIGGLGGARGFMSETLEQGPLQFRTVLSAS